MQELGILLTFAGGLAAALVLGFFAIKLKLSPIIGYLLAGIAVGPFTPGFVANHTIAEQFSEIGVILLLFGIGLRFHLRELLAVWNVAIPGALIQSSISTAVMALLLRSLGWSWLSGLILGMAISVASTVVMAKVLAERRDLHSPIGHIAFGWTVVEDILTVLLLLLLPILFAPGESGTKDPLATLSFAGLKVAGLVVVVVALGRWIIPWILEKIEKTRSRELFTLAVLVLALGIAVGSARIFGVSIALGAFLAGLAVGRSDFAARAAGDAVPMRDAFAVLFFVSVGMLFDPQSLVKAPLITALVLCVVVVVKPLAALLTVRILGRPFSTAVPVGAAFSQVGEFSFILGSVATSLGLINDTGWNALVAASIISIALNPTLYGWARRAATIGQRRVPAIAPEQPVVDPHRCILVGFGPVGKIVFGLLSENKSEITVIDLNLETVRRLRAEGHKAVYGDILRPGTLEEAGIATAGSLILSADVEDAPEIVRQARILNPKLRVLARCGHLRDAAALRLAGANVIAAGEAEVGVALAEAISPVTDLDCKFAMKGREAIREELYGSADMTLH